MARGDGRRPTAVTLSWVACALSALTTLVVALAPSLHFAYRHPDAHLVVETTAALTAALLALLLYGRFRRSGLLQELLLVYALGVLAVAALGFVVLPLIAGARPGSVLTTWAPLVVRLVAALLLASAALTPDRLVRLPSRMGWDAVVMAAVLAGVALAAAVLADVLPAALESQPDPERSVRPTLEETGWVLLAQGMTAACFGTAAVLFTRQASRTEDGLRRWLGAGFTVGFWSRVDYLLFPSLNAGWLYVGDLLRLASYVVLLVGAVQEIRAYWAAQAEMSAAVERRRLARDLHDGAVQEIGYIRTQAKVLARTTGSPEAERIQAAADRALDEARRALDALTAPPDEPLSASLRRAACDLGDRYDLSIRLDLDETVDVDPEPREALLRIAREAVANAARHAAATVVWVRLRAGVLEVDDDGRGFNVQAGGRTGGFGLTSMRERAEAVGATLAVESSAGAGTTLRVVW